MARISASFCPSAISIPYVSRTRNQRFDTSAIFVPSRSISYSWSMMLPLTLSSLAVVEFDREALP